MTFEQLAKKYNLVQNEKTLPNYISFVYPALPHLFNGAFIYHNKAKGLYFIANKPTIDYDDYGDGGLICSYKSELEFETVEELDEYMSTFVTQLYNTLITSYKQMIQKNKLKEIEVDFV